jgi:hypothetical protein
MSELEMIFADAVTAYDQQNLVRCACFDPAGPYHSAEEPCGAAHAHVGDPRFIAPTLSFSIEFQHRTRSAGLLSDAHAPSATEGRIVVHNRVWSPDGLSLATGSGTLICRSRPQR